MFDFLFNFFTVPGFLLGTAAAAIPFVIHLIYRKRAPKVFFPTLMFLLASVQRTARRKRLQELLLLTLRSLALFLLAVGLAGFHLPGLGGGSDVGMGLVFDNSYSMAARAGEGTVFQAANRSARDMVKSLGRGGSVALCWSNVVPPAAEASGSVGEQLTQDRQRIREDLRAADVSCGYGSVTSAILRAEKILAVSGSPTRFVCVVSDLQAAGWKSLAEPAEVRGRPVPVIVIDHGGGGFRNLAVTGVDLHGKGQAVGVPLTIEAQLLNSSKQEQEVPVKLFVGRVPAPGEAASRAGADSAPRLDLLPPQRASVKMGAGASASVAFTLVFDRPGPYAGWVEVETEDSVDVDNRRYFAVRINDRIPVLLVKEAEGPVPALDEAFYLLRALDPGAAGTTDVRSPVAPKELLLEGLATADLSGYPAVFLLDVPTLSDVQLATLAAYVEKGGTLVVFPGDSVDRAGYSAAARSAPGLPAGLLPAELGPLGGDVPRGETYAAVTEPDTSHPVLVAFKGLPRRSFESIHLWRWHTLRPVTQRPVSVLARLNSKAPFLVEGRVGAGRVFLFCCSAGTEWTNFPARMLYAPLMHEIVYSSVGSIEFSLSHYPGAEVHLGIKEPADDMELADPLGNRFRHLAPKDFPRRMYAPGIYLWRELKPPGRHGAIVVNPVPEEADLTPLSHEEVRKLLAGRPATFVSSAAEARRELARIRKGVQLWTFVLFLVLAIALAECFMANRPPRDEKTPARLHPTFGGGQARRAG